MKTLILLSSFLLLCSFSTSTAQTLKGDRMVGGSASFSVSEENTSLSLSPSMSWFVVNNLAIGGTVDYSYGRSSFSSDSFSYLTKSNSIYLGPSIRYYFTKEGRLGCFSFAGFGVRSGYYNYNGEKENATAFSGGIGVGLSYFITEQVALEGLAGYYASDFFDDDRETYRRFALSFGFQIFLPAKK
jgi:hypothetical protein